MSCASCSSYPSSPAPLSAESFNSIESVVNLSIKYQLAYMERYLLDSLSKLKFDTCVVPVQVQFEETGAETTVVCRQTAEFLFNAFNWQGCRVGANTDLITVLPGSKFTRYSITFFIDNPTTISIKAIMDILNSMFDKRMASLAAAKVVQEAAAKVSQESAVPKVPKLVHDPTLTSIVSQRVAKLDTVVNPATIVDVVPP